MTDCHVHNAQSGFVVYPNVQMNTKRVPAVFISETSPSCSIADCVISANYLQRPCPHTDYVYSVFYSTLWKQKRVLDASASHSDVADLNTHSNGSPDFIPATTYNSPHSLPNFSPAKSHQNGQDKKKGSK